MIKQPNYPKNDMNASAPLNIQSLKAPQEYDQTMQNTIDEKQKRPMSGKNKNKLPAKINK